MNSDDDFARIKTLVLERSMEDTIRKTARSQLPMADPQPGNGKLEIGEVWNDGVDAPAPVAPGRKDDAGKPRWDLLPASVVEVVKVLTVGAKRYGDDNWRGLETPRRRYYSALLRHVTAWYYGERNDPDDGLHHLAHAMCCALFLMEFDK